MLILSRNTDESILIGDDIEITVLEVQGKQVRLGIKAPQRVTVHRAEVYVKIQQETRQIEVEGCEVEWIEESQWI